MKVVVCGSRSWTDQSAIWDRLRQLPLDSVVITGGAAGADSIAEWGARYLGLTSKVMRAHWEIHGKRAGYMRNVAMLNEEPALVIAFWDGKSKGTKHTICEARMRGIPVEVIAQK